jgi:hypothetical protein
MASTKTTKKDSSPAASAEKSQQKRRPEFLFHLPLADDFLLFIRANNYSVETHY